METSETQVRIAFDMLLDTEPAARTAILESAYPGDLPLHRRLLAMIAAAEDESFLSGSTVSPSEESVFVRRLPGLDSNLVGSRVGPYEVVEKIGEGGFGTVYRARQIAPVTRQVAIKVINLGMNTRQVLARFEQERQALAILDHPNIARVIDAGATQTGQPFVVMDLVKGESIVHYCDQRKLDIKARLELFSQVCSAVQHAHTKGVIHRDIKPSNVLVTIDGDLPLVKVIDFGIAKATSARLTDNSFVTEQRLLLGTPEYMSPEQAAGAADIDTRADVYSLGALLYELLTGDTPFSGKELRSAELAEVRRTLREDDPPKPSTRILKSEPSAAESVATARQVSPQKLATVIRGELDWITLKALEKDRDRRYATVNSLLADVTRYLNSEAVHAAPPSTIYLIRKTARRHRAAAVATIAIALSLTIGAIAFAWQAHRIKLQRDDAITARNAERTARDAAVIARDAEKAASDLATTNARTAQGVSTFFSSEILARADPGRSATTHPVSLAETIDLAAAKVDKRFPNDPLIRGTIRLALGQSYRGMGFWKKATTQFETAYPLILQTRGEDSTDTLLALDQLADIYRVAGNFNAAEPLFNQLIARSQHLGDDNVFKFLAQLGLGQIRLFQGRPADALPLLQSAHAGQIRLNGEKNIQALNTLNAIVQAYLQLGQITKAIETDTQLIAMLRATVGENDMQTAQALSTLGECYGQQRQYDQAITLLKQAAEIYRILLGEDDPQTLATRAGIARFMLGSGDRAGARTLDQDIIRIARASAKIDPGTFANLNARHATILAYTGDFPGAEKAYLESYPILAKSYGPNYSITRQTIEALVRLYTGWHRPADAAKWQSLLQPSTTAPTTKPAANP